MRVQFHLKATPQPIHFLPSLLLASLCLGRPRAATPTASACTFDGFTRLVQDLLSLKQPLATSNRTCTLPSSTR